MAQYASKDISSFEGLKPVRRRPGRHSGGAGFIRLVREILEDVVDEAMKGHASCSLAA
jgi:DNA gyrase/topoisomerase IV subunit B